MLKNLPPALVITAENDVLHDESEKLTQKPDKADVDVCCARILGVCHGFMMLNAISETASAKMAFNLVYFTINSVLYSISSVATKKN